VATAFLPPKIQPQHTIWAGRVSLTLSAPAGAVQNMARDEAMLLTAAETGDTLVRLYQWSEPSVSFGRNQTARGTYTEERCAARGVPAVRRLTGGRALLHAREVTYAVAAPNSTAPTLRSGYEAINELLLAALGSLGIDARRATPTARATAPGQAPCFETPTVGELVVNGHKLVGSAQHRDARAFLQHGSILLDNDQGLLQELALVQLPAVPAPATVRALRPDADAAMVMAAIAGALRGAAGGDVAVTTDADLPSHHVERAATRYRDPRWTWRR
jgi:lipoyl(octanoyl) transferase